MKKSGAILLWNVVMSILVLTSVSSLICVAQGNANVHRSVFGFQREGYTSQEQQLDVSRAAGNPSWRISAVPKRREENDIAQQCAADLFALFGGQVAASVVEKSRAKELLGSIRLLAPDLEPWPLQYGSQEGKLEGEELAGILQDDVNVFKKKIASPPAAVEELARKTVEWGGDPNVVLNALAPTTYAVPDVEGSSEERCTLTKYDDGRRFAKKDLTKYMAFLFEAIRELSPAVGLNISLTRFDLFHGHMFTAYNTGRLGILFHSKEYPAYDEKKFPLNLGFCQKGSTLPYDASMALRNIVWLAPMPDCSPVLNSSNQTSSRKWLAPGSLFVLDTGQGKILDRELVPDYLDVVHTVSEDDLGDVMIDVNYFDFVNETLENRVFLC